ncbi:MAG TPA: hypothetical protein VGL34_23510 [Steroidobacteraceae bacterium]|jgi:hypothetical protein
MSEHEAAEQLAPATVDTWRVVIVAVSVVLFLITSMGIMAAIFFALAPSNRAPAPAAFPPPELQAHPARDLQHYLVKQHAELNSYRWTSSDHSFVVIPIERAMEMIAQRGANAYDPIETSKTASTPQTGAEP